MARVFLKISNRKEGKMGKLSGITSGTYLTKRIKNPENKNLNKKDICNDCKLKGICKYKDISKFNKGKIFENNVKCNEFYFTITSKAILNLGRDRTTGKMITKTFTLFIRISTFRLPIAFIAKGQTIIDQRAALPITRLAIPSGAAAYFPSKP